MSGFSLSRIDRDDRYDKLFGELGKDKKELTEEEIEQQRIESELRDEAMYQKEFQDNVSNLESLFGTDFDSMLNNFDEQFKTVNEIAKDEFKEVKMEDMVKLSEEEAIKLNKKRFDVANAFSAKEIYDDYTDDELKHLRTRQAIDMEMEVSQSNAINDPDSPAYRPGAVTERRRTNNSNQASYTFEPNNVGGGINLGGTKTQTTTNNNFGGTTNKTTTPNNEKDYGEMRQRYNAFFRTVVSNNFAIGTQRMAGWSDDKRYTKKLIEKENRYENSEFKKQVNKVKHFLKSKRFKITAKVTALVCLNIVMGITTKTIEFESTRQMLTLIGISVGSFYISRELTEDGISLKSALI